MSSPSGRKEQAPQVVLNEARVGLEPMEVALGKPYGGTAKPWQEGTDFNWAADFWELRIFWKRPKPSEIDAVQNGKAEFAVAVIEGIIFFLFRFGNMPWSDSSYTWHLVDPLSRTSLPAEPRTEEERMLLNVFLMDAADGKVMAMRRISFSPSVYRALAAAVGVQAASEWKGRAHYLALGDKIYKRFRTPEAMLDAAVARGFGGLEKESWMGGLFSAN